MQRLLTHPVLQVHILRMTHPSLDRELTTAKGILSRAAQTENELRALLSDAEAAGAGGKKAGCLSTEGASTAGSA